MRKILFILLTSFLFFGCASHKYTRDQRATNNTFNIKTNIDGVELNFAFASKDNKYLTRVGRTGYTHTYRKLWFWKTFLVLSGDHVETKKVKIWRAPRLRAVGKDAALGLVTWFTPLVIDPLVNPDFYQVASGSKNIYVTMKYKQEFMLKQFQSIEKSDNIELFKNYINEYPESNSKELAVNKKDSLELKIAIGKRSEKAMDEYISSHSSSKFLKDAQKIKNDFAEARTEFSKAKSLDNVLAYENFISKYPNSIEYNDAHVLLINAAEKQALSLNNSDASLKYFDNYLVKFSSFLKKEDFETKKNTVTSAIDQQIVSENVDEKNKYNSYSKLWKRYQDILSSKAENLGYFEKAESYREKISNELFNALTKLNTEAAQTDFIKNANIDFPKFVKYEFLNQTFLSAIFEPSQSLNGLIKLYNQNHIPNFVKNNCGERCPLAGKSSYQYKGNYLEAFVGANYEEITFKNGYFSDIKVFKDKQLLTSFKFTDFYVSEANFYQNGKLARTDYVEPNRNYYSYDFENGVNISLKELDNKIDNADKALAANDFDKALNILNNDCKNNYPSSVAQNIRISNTLSKVNQAKNAYLKKQEEIRLAEEKRREEVRLAEERKQEAIRIAEEQRKVQELKERYKPIVVDPVDFLDNRGAYVGKTLRFLVTYGNSNGSWPNTKESTQTGGQYFDYVCRCMKDDPYKSKTFKSENYKVFEFVDGPAGTSVTVNVPDEFFNNGKMNNSFKDGYLVIDFYVEGASRWQDLKLIDIFRYKR